MKKELAITGLEPVSSNSGGNHAKLWAGSHQHLNIDGCHFQNPSEDGVTRRFKFPHEFKGRPQSLPEFQYAPSEQLELPEVGTGSGKPQPDEEEPVYDKHPISNAKK